MAFKSTHEAGERLSAALALFKASSPVILALPRRGVPVGAEIAVRLGAPLDLVVVRKIGVPEQPEFAKGAIAEGNPPVVARNEPVVQFFEIKDAEFESAKDRRVDRDQAAPLHLPW